jgi:hypothetical protein
MRFFDDIAGAIKSGVVTSEDVGLWAALVYGEDTPDCRQKFGQCVRVDGLNQFQTVTLHKMAREFHDKAEVALANKIDETSTPVPEELLRDVPEPVYDEPLPDVAGEIKKRLGIIACVRKFGKKQDSIRDRNVEGIKVRCPFPSHNDAHPSAWCNSEKNTWFCGSCQVGGDVIDFYAATKGMNVKTYHTDGSFPTLVKEMGSEMGLSVKRTRDGSYELVDDEAELPSPLPDRAPEPEPVRTTPPAIDDEGLEDYVPPAPVAPPSHEASEPITVTVDKMLSGVSFKLEDLDLDEIDVKTIPELNWTDLPINPQTFLGQFMPFAEEYYPWVPREFFLFAGLQAIGLAMGHHVTSETGARLSGSLMCLFIGPSGAGKSTAVSELRAMFGRIPITKFNPSLGSGVKIIPSPGSAEALVKSIRTEVEDPTAEVPGTKMEVGATAWMHEDEFATLISKSKRNGSTFKTRIIGLYDFVKKDPSRPEVVFEEYSLSGGHRVLHDSYFSATFTTQTDAIRSLMEHNDLVSGFLNRIVPVMGRRRARRRISSMLVPPTVPDHDDHYERLWRWCRADYRTIPFTNEAKEVFDDHPFIHHVEGLANTDSLYSRVSHMTLRLAFLLAVNNHSREVTPEYVEAACTIGSQYLLDCFQGLHQSVIASEIDDGAKRIESYVSKFYDRKGRWPTKREWTKDRSYNDYKAEDRARSMKILLEERRVVEVVLTDGAKRERVLMVPTGSWAGFEDSHEKKFVKDEFYAGIEEK